jgi:hypothetical protein
MDVSLAWLYDPEQPAIIPFHFASNQRFFKAYGQSLLISGLLTLHGKTWSVENSEA